MKKKRVLLCLLFSLCIPISLIGGSYNWTGPGTQWDLVGNWGGGGYPGLGAYDDATLSIPTLPSINLSAAMPGSIYSINISTFNSLTLTSSGTPFFLNSSTSSSPQILFNSAYNHFISAPINNLFTSEAYFINNTSNQATLSGVLSGQGYQFQKGPFALTGAAANTFTGRFVVTSGATVSLSNDNQMGTSSNGITLSDATLNPTATITNSRPVTISGTGIGAVFNVQTGTTTTLSGTITRIRPLFYYDYWNRNVNPIEHG